jgi:hypothetical protein
MNGKYRDNIYLDYIAKDRDGIYKVLQKMADNCELGDATKIVEVGVDYDNNKIYYSYYAYKTYYSGGEVNMLVVNVL